MPMPLNHPWRSRVLSRVRKKERSEPEDTPADEFAEIRTDPVIQRPEELDE